MLTVDVANEVLVGDGGHGDASRCVVPLWWAAVRRLAVPTDGLTGRAPCVVMAHGTTGTMDFGLARYAQRFAAAGFAVLVFDYRHFGASDGRPRQLIRVGRQVADWRAAVWFARALPRSTPSGWRCGAPRLAGAML